MCEAGVPSAYGLHLSLHALSWQGLVSVACMPAAQLQFSMLTKLGL